MKKTLLSIMLAIVCAFMLVGCDVADNITNIASTTQNVYDTYSDGLLVCQKQFLSDVATVHFEDADSTNISVILNNLELLSKEELVVMATIECHNVVSSKKEISLDMKDGVIYTRYVNNQDKYPYECTMLYDDNTTVSYFLKVEKNNQSGNYKVSYSKNGKECQAIVGFSKSTSNLSLDFTSYDEDENLVQIKKEIYVLKNNHFAMRVNLLFGSSSNRLIYGVDYYKEVARFKTKLAKCNATSGKIQQENLFLDKFVNSLSTDTCGYLVSYTTGTKSIEKFGEITKW